MMTMNGDNPLPLVVVGYDFRRASTKWRSHLVLKMSEQNDLANQLEDAGMATGLIVLSTCNRNELIVSTGTPNWTGEILRARLMQRLKTKTGQSRVPEPYVLTGETAVRHMVRVASGLESFVLGERQIASQLNCAVNTAQKMKHSSVILNGLGTSCGKASREAVRVRFGEGGIRGVHDAAVRYLESHYDPAKQHTVLVVGTGAIGKQAIQSLHVRTKWNVIPVNRTDMIIGANTTQSIKKLPELLEKADMLIACTGAFEPTITPNLFGNSQPETPVICIDLGIPNQIDNSVDELAVATVVNLDGLQEAGVVNSVDETSLNQLNVSIDEIVTEFAQFCRERDLVTVLNATQTQHEHYVHQVIPEFIETELPELSDENKARVAFKLRGLVREYTNTIFDSIHKTTQDDQDD